MADADLTVEEARLKRMRRPDLVLPQGLAMLEKQRASLGNSQWEIREQVFMAALDLHKFEIARKQFELLEQRFPTSLRVRALEGMIFEAQAHHSGLTSEQSSKLAGRAMEIYTEIVLALCHELNVVCAYTSQSLMKILSTYSRGSGRQLNAYLEMYPTDAEAWKELADVYLEMQQLENARKALEEVLILAPMSYLSHLKLAEVLYTLEEHHLARSYYAQSLELKSSLSMDNSRAALGMILCTTVKLMEIARDHLVASYECCPGASKGPELRAVQAWLT
ncbi:hypothetical protein GUITHDRAFT_166438 [Guillardia theta CCMP2712]|uniref:ER membrane protein complex subunit 2 n=1 Tax=Guillardia theta (strain CCMP2712) TaxID=905079 RepID=L1ICH6_GUITC|nr:hypothetical protein GUITHDRAFT_166438 [Guillardia theta CCMP2712]EKX33545.1 hypothetical protein GUITHDRAFT_166438 [Guillardia theta CCMP2712]|eukprot:XP_005820525.1 hypothetical protein GUITHDRAFT_166438 [Guillardia theta CCMP2712]